jgi:recombination protein RecA
MSKKTAVKKTPTVSAATQNTVLQTIIAQINKSHGIDAIATLGHSGGYIRLSRQLSSGSLILDTILGPFFRKADGTWQYGFADGRMMELFGPEQSGKTSLTLHIIAEAQKRGGVCAFIDAEHALDPNWARRLGVNLDALLFSQPQSGEQALQIVEQLLKSNSMDVIVVDSLAALIPKSMLEGEIGDASMGKQAKMMSEALARFTTIKTKTLLIFTNQLREKLGIMFGNPEVTPGGRALKFYASYRIDVRKGETLTEGGINVGHKMRVKLIKNKLSPPYQIAELDFRYDLRPDWPAGIDKVAELFELAVANQIILMNGSWVLIDGKAYAQGKTNAINALRLDRVLMWSLFERTMTAILASRGYTPEMTPLPGMPAMPVARAIFEQPTAEDLANSAGQDSLEELTEVTS